MRGCVVSKAKDSEPWDRSGQMWGLCNLPKCYKMGYLSDNANSIISEGILEVT